MKEAKISPVREQRKQWMDCWQAWTSKNVDMHNTIRPGFDLEKRTTKFAEDMRHFLRRIPPSPYNIDDIKQLLRSSGSVGANYIEANESLGRKDFIMHIKISRKEAKESRFWLCIIDTTSQPDLMQEKNRLIDEAEQLERIFGAIVRTMMLKS